MGPVLSYIYSTTIPLILKTGMYFGVFRWKRFETTLLSCIIIAGIPVLLSGIPMPIPFISGPLILITLSSFLCSTCVNIRFFPEALVVAIVVETASYLLLRFVIFPIVM